MKPEDSLTYKRSRLWDPLLRRTNPLSVSRFLTMVVYYAKSKLDVVKLLKLRNVILGLGLGSFGIN